MARAEEHVFLNVLVHRLHYRQVTDIQMGCISYQRFTRQRNFYRVPLACRTTSRGLELEKEKELLRVRQDPAHGGCLFARKLPPERTCDLSCFAASGFERFQCEK